MRITPGVVIVGLILAILLVGGVWFISEATYQPPDSDFGSPDPKPTRDPKVAAAELDKNKQKIIWDAEHITFELEKRFGKSLLAALANDDREKVIGFFRDGFQGSVIDGPTADRHKGLISEFRRTAKTPTGAADVSQVVDALRNPLPKMKSITGSKFRVLEIERLDKAAAKWKTHVLMSFTGLDDKSLPVQWESEHWIECTIENDKELENVPIVDRWEIVSETERRAKSWLLEEVTSDWGLSRLPIPDNWKLSPAQVDYLRFQIAVADFDRDGDLDVAVAVNHVSANPNGPPIGGGPLFLESDNGRFRDVAAQKGLKSWPGAENHGHLFCCSFDYNNDGWPDLIMGQRLYRNESGRFVDVAFESGIRIERECMGAVTADYDGDGLLDLYLIYQVSPEGPDPNKHAQWVDDEDSGGKNRLWRNLGNGRFKDVTETAGASGGNRHTHAAAWFFYDDDHFPDLYLANDFGKNVILRNKGDGSFEDVSQESNISDFATSMGVAVGDIDNNGRSDIYVANMYSKMGRRIIGQVCEADYPAGIFNQIRGSCAGNRLYLGNAEKTGYREVSTQVGVNSVGWAYAPAIVDLDCDGWLDLYATTGFQSFDRKKPDG